MHEALFGAGARLFGGVANINGRAQIYFASPGVTGGLPGVAINPQIRQNLLERAAARADKDRVALPAGGDEGILVICRDANRWVRFTVGFGHQPDILETVVFAVERECLFGP